MATHDHNIIQWSMLPDGVGNVFVNPAAANFGANDRYNHQVVEFLGSLSTKDGFGGSFKVPQNYVGTPILVIEWSTTVTINDVVWDFDFTSAAVGATWDPSTDTRTHTVTDTAPATARFGLEATITLTAGDYTAGRKVLYNFSRDQVDAADDLAATAYLFGLFFRYNDA